MAKLADDVLTGACTYAVSNADLVAASGIGFLVGTLHGLAMCIALLH